MYKAHHVSVIIPAYNEALAISSVLKDLLALENTEGSQVFDHIIVCDNNSSDKTSELAKAHNVDVVFESQAGYGSACQRGLLALGETDIVLFVDADASIEISETKSLLDEIVNGNDLVIGNRVRSLREKNALHWQQLVGTQLACQFMSFLFRTTVSDLGPFRAIRSSSLKKLDMQDRRFGWTAEMQVKAMQHDMQIAEIPVSVKARIGKSKISGTLRGTVLAGYDILKTIWVLWKSHRQSQQDLETRLVK